MQGVNNFESGTNTLCVIAIDQKLDISKVMVRFRPNQSSH